MTPQSVVNDMYHSWASAQNHMIALTGQGLGDYATGYVAFPQYLTAQLAKAFAVITYTRSRGIEFPERHEASVRAACPPPEQSDAFAALSGNTQSSGPAPFPVDLDAALDYLQDLMDVAHIPHNGQKLRVCVIFSYADLLWPDNAAAATSSQDRTALEQVLLWADDPEWSNGVNHPMIVFMANDKAAINARLRRKCAQIAVELPNYDQRLAHILFELNNTTRSSAIELDDLTPERFAALTAGLERKHISDVFGQAELEGNALISARDVQEFARKMDKSQLDGVLVIENPTGSLDDVAGHQHVIDYLRQDVIPAMLSGDARGVPKGILLAGPPGTGKSWLAQKLASESGVNFVEMRMSRILNMYVGQSESNMDLALEGVRARFPCVLFIDEIDQAFQRGGNDGNRVGSNLFGRFISFLGEPGIRGKVLLVAATNKPDLMDGALRRSGRFDAKIALLAPQNAAERHEMFEVLSRVHDLPIQADLTDAVAMSEGFTGADIELILNEAFRMARRAGLDTIDQQALDDAMHYVIPSMVDVQAYTDAALAEVNNLLLLPENLRDKVAQERRGEPAQQPRQTSNQRRVVRKKLGEQDND